MCRIAGIFSPGANVDQLEVAVEGMCELLKHGGPDDKGIYSSPENGLVLGNRRLALVDLTPAGHMPMQYLDRYFITYNGELYNYPALKEELIQLGHRFQNHTDTEVVLAVFAQWKTQGFSRLKGMFAFALWDSVEKELFLVRDQAGIKPLYFAEAADSLVFASEVRAFKNFKGLEAANENWPVYLMAYGHLPEPVTILSKVKPLQKGSYLRYDLKNKSSAVYSYSHYSYSQQIDDSDDLKQLIRTSFQKAVNSHLISDAPLGVFLSGGLDSGVIAALASQSKKSDLKTISIYFEEPAYSEKKYQDVLIRELQCDHHQYMLKEEEFHTSFPMILNNMDMPSCDGVNTWFIANYAASQGLKAVLSGVGGDELFGGYPSFGRLGAASLMQHLPYYIVKAGKKSGFKKLNRMSYLDIPGIKGLYLFLRGHFTPYEIARQLGTYEKDVWTILKETPVLGHVDNLEYKNQASWMEFNLYMQNQLLRDSDVMSMIHGVEIRVPFLDDDFIRLLFKISANVKYQGPRAKQLLINSFSEIVPNEIWNRPKMGFSFPFSKWLKSSAFVQNLMAGGSLNARKSYSKFMEGKLHWSHMMSLIILRHRELIGHA